ncbi:MAG: FAD-dependent oxidoreductase [Cellulosilyticaceae bacterium]
MAKHIYIIGGGYGGVEAALTLQKKKKAADNIEIHLIDKNNYHTLLTELHEVAAERVEDDGIIVPFKQIFEYTDVDVIQDNVSEIKFEDKKIVTEHGTYDYDYLVLALGSEPNYFGIEGMKEYAMPFWSYDQCLAVKERVKENFQKAKYEKNATKRKEYLTFVVGGGGFTGTELVGELAHWTNQLAVEYGIDRSEVSIILVEAQDTVLSILDKKLIDKAVNYMSNKLGIKILTSTRVTKVEEDKIIVNDKQIIPTYTFVWTGGVKANEDLANEDLEKGRGARIVVDGYTRTQHKDVYAVGDLSLFTTEEGNPLAALVESAMQTGKAAGKNILHDIRSEEVEKCKPALHGVMVSFGHKYAVAQLGGKGNIKLSGFFALLMKHFINLHYLFGIGGFEICWSYIRHEWFDQKHGNDFIRNHMTHMTPTFWITLLRVYLGWMWLASGIEKIQSGWFANVMLAGSTVDATAGASLMQLVSGHTPGFYAWFVDNLIVPNAMIFQFVVVMTELALGLAFISGSFVFLAALVSIAMNLNFLISTGLQDLWFLAASIPMLGGAGRAFGLDQYIMPYLSKQWRYIIRKHKLSFTLKK